MTPVSPPQPPNTLHCRPTNKEPPAHHRTPAKPHLVPSLFSNSRPLQPKQPPTPTKRTPHSLLFQAVSSNNQKRPSFSGKTTTKINHFRVQTTTTFIPVNTSPLLFPAKPETSTPSAPIFFVFLRQQQQLENHHHFLEKTTPTPIFAGELANTTNQPTELLSSTTKLPETAIQTAFTPFFLGESFNHATSNLPHVRENPQLKPDLPLLLSPTSLLSASSGDNHQNNTHTSSSSQGKAAATQTTTEVSTSPAKAAARRRRAAMAEANQNTNPNPSPTPTPTPSGGEVPPNVTIYINNLNEKIKLEELKKSMHAVFSQFGKILEVLAFKTLKHKGQAWVVFEEVSSASNALRQMQGFPFYDKPMRIQYAKTKSDVVAKADGTFVPREKRKRHEDKGRKKKDQQDANQAGMGLNPAYAGAYGAAPPFSQIPYMGGAKAAVPEAPAPPNSILFVQNLPHQSTPMMLQMLFCQYPGFKEVRMVEAKPGIAFIEYGDEMQSTVAMQALQGFKITAENPMLITYAKK